MYKLITARYRADRKAGRWVEGDLSNSPIGTVTATYGEVILYITYPGLFGLKALRFDNVRNLIEPLNPNMTIQSWLTSLGNTTLPFEAELPPEQTQLVKYGQAWHLNYKFEPVERTREQRGFVPSEALPDLLATHDTISLDDMRDYSLWTVNGLFHLSGYTTTGIRIYGGNNTIRTSGDNQIGVYSFQDVGKLVKCPITPDMISPQSQGRPYNDGVYLTVPDTYDIENKSVLFIIGGFLIPFGRNCVQTGDRTFRLNPSAILTLDRWLMLNKSIDLSSLGLEQSDQNPNALPVQQLKSDPVIEALLTLVQSFIVIVDAPSMFQDFIAMEPTQLPGRYVDRTGDQLPLLGASGKMLDYHTIFEYDRYMHCAVLNWRYDYVGTSTDWLSSNVVDDGAYPVIPAANAQAYKLMLGTEEAGSGVDGFWETVNTNGTPKANASMEFVNGKFYVFGGYSNWPYVYNAPTRTVSMFDPALGVWTQKQPMPFLVTRPATAVLGTDIYFYDESRVLYRYDTLLDSWNTVSQGPAFTFTSICVSNDNLYVLGDSQFCRYNFATQTWLELNPLFMDKTHFRMFFDAPNNRVIAVPLNSYSTIYSYSLLLHEWEILAEAPEKVITNAVIKHNKLYVLCGSDSWGNKMYRLPLTENNWDLLRDVDVYATDVAMATDGDIVYTYGGAGSVGRVDLYNVQILNNFQRLIG